MFKEYNPIQDKLFRIIDDDGMIINKEWMPELSNEQIVKRCFLPGQLIYKSFLISAREGSIPIPRIMARKQFQELQEQL